MNGLYYECGPGTPTNNRGESICVNPSNNFYQPNNHRLPSDITGKHIIHLEHDNDKKIVYYNDGNGNITLKEISGSAYNNDDETLLLGNITANDTNVYASKSNFNLVHKNDKNNLFCDDDLLLDDDTGGVSNKTLLDCKN